MTMVLLFALVLQQAAPGVVWSDDPPAPIEETVVAAPVPVLPAEALADPYGWERSQCSPFIRKDEPLEHCQARVRVTLAPFWATVCPTACAPRRRWKIAPRARRRTATPCSADRARSPHSARRRRWRRFATAAPNERPAAPSPSTTTAVPPRARRAKPRVCASASAATDARMKKPPPREGPTA